MPLEKSLHHCFVKNAHQEGLLLASTVDIHFVMNDTQAIFQKHVQRYDAWLKAGYFGEMHYLVRGRDFRANPQQLFLEVKSVGCVAISCLKHPFMRSSINASEAHPPRLAQYLKGPDYHLWLKDKLHEVMLLVQKDFPELKWKICVDTSAVLERTWAFLSGLGWIGKNTLLIHPRWGSYLLLAEVFMNLPTDQPPSPRVSFCGACQRCLKACPTQALSQENGLDARRCISYWTLEKRGALNLTQENAEKIGTWIAGCDLCQEVCPFNRKSLNTRVEQRQLESSDENINPLWESLVNETLESYKNRLKNSALERIRYPDWKRNIDLAYKNKALLIK